MYYQSNYNSPIGKLIIVSDEKNLVGLWMEGQKYFLGTLKHVEIICHETDVMIQVKNWLDRYFALKKPVIKELPMAPIGGDFRQSV